MENSIWYSLIGLECFIGLLMLVIMVVSFKKIRLNNDFIAAFCCLCQVVLTISLIVKNII